MSKSDLRTNLATAMELLGFSWNSKRWWLAPIIVALLLLGFIVGFLETSAVAPFVYALF